MRRILLSLTALLCFVSLTGCSQIQLASHLVKKILPYSSNSHSQGAFKVGSPYKIQGKWYKPKEEYDLVQTGIASWYGPQFHGKKTANGEIFDMYALTAAHKTLQMPSMVRVTNLENGRSLVVRVNDRGPYKRGRIIDLSKKSATLLGFKDNGTAKVRIKVLREESHRVAEAARRGSSTKGYEVAVNRATSYPNKQTAKIFSETIEYVKAAAVEEVITMPIADQSVKVVARASALPAPSVGIHVQAGAFSLYENAVKLQNRLGKIAKTSITPINVNGRKLYRVRMSAVDVAQADSLMSILMRDGNSSAMIIVD